jgi:hypothetical protein
MAEQKTRPESTKRINVDREQDVRYWAERLCCTEEELRQAVITAGASVMSVQQLLSR